MKLVEPSEEWKSAEPAYVVELVNGQDVNLKESEIVGAGTGGALAGLQRWYSAQCDGDWEHSDGITIGTIDNPGWSVVVELSETALEGAHFDEVEVHDSEREWLHCRVQERRFEGHGGPHMLGRIIRTFLEWAAHASRSAA